MTSTTSFLPSIPLGRQAHQLAQRFSAQQATPRQGKQVYLNTLAVYAVHRYLTWLGIETDLNHSESWNPITQTLLNAADILIPNAGRLDCLFALPGATILSLPPEGMTDRIGCVGVQMSDRLDEAFLLGFMPATVIAPSMDCIAIADLQSLDALIDYLAQVSTTANVTAPHSSLVLLGQWLSGLYDAGWQSLDEVLGQAEPTLAYGVRSANQSNDVTWQRGKLIDFGMQLADQAVVMVVALIPEPGDEITVVLQVHPVHQSHLPPQLELTVLDETETVIMTGRSRAIDNYIQLTLSGSSGERFSARVSLGEVSVTEQFVI